jgi:hypothetical protein
MGPYPVHLLSALALSPVLLLVPTASGLSLYSMTPAQCQLALTLPLLKMHHQGLIA